MFSPPRFVVVDDRADHLDAIVTALRGLGTACLPVHFDAARPLAKQDFAGVRCLFLDLQLLSNSRRSDYSADFGTLQGILEEVISPQGGPYVLVLWTNQPDQASALESYLEDHLPAEFPHCRPVAVVPLSKSDYISLRSGEVRDLSSIMQAVSESVSQASALSALIRWELDLLSAAAKVMNDLVGLAQSTGPTIAERGRALSNVLERLSVGAVGETNVDYSKRDAVHSALLPLLTDRLQNPSDPGESTWSHAFDDSSQPLPRLDSAGTALVNSRLHLDFGASQPFDWGAVSSVPNNFDWYAIGVSGAAGFKEEMKLKDVVTDQAARDASAPVRIRVGAACDYAQRSTGPVPMVFGLIVRARSGAKPWANKGLSNLWISPLLEYQSEFVQLVAHPRFTYVTSAKRFTKVASLFRLKEQILLELVSRIATYESRPGIISFRPES